MGELPYIDDHLRVISASPDQVWQALIAVLAGSFRTLPKVLEIIWQPAQPRRVGDWRSPAVGDALPGFEVAEVAPDRRLLLRGAHRFSIYELHFTLEPDVALPCDRTTLRARTSAVFPGILGLSYRTLVISTGLHVVAVRRMLNQIAQHAERD